MGRKAIENPLLDICGEYDPMNLVNPFWYAAGNISTKFVTGQTLGTSRTDGGGAATGFRLLTGGSTVTVTHVGRYKAAGDSANHFVGFFADSSVPISGGSATVDMSQSADADGYVYVQLATPLVLSSSTYYRLMSVETTGVDTFYNFDTVITTTAVASVLGGCYATGGAAGGGSVGSDLGGADHSYGPVTFKYSSP